MEDLSRLPAIRGDTHVRGTFRVAAWGDVITSPFSGARGVIFRWHFVNVENLGLEGAGMGLGLGGSILESEAFQRHEHAITTVDRRAPFLLVDDAGQAVAVPERAAIMGLSLSFPRVSQPVPRFPVELAGIEQAARALPGEPAYRECFLIPETVVEVDMMVRQVSQQVMTGYRDAPHASFEALAIRNLVEVEEDAAGLPVTAGVGKRVGRWFSKLFR